MLRLSRFQLLFAILTAVVLSATAPTIVLAANGSHRSQVGLAERRAVAKPHSGRVAGHRIGSTPRHEGSQAVRPELEAGCRGGFDNLNMAGVGEVLPRVMHGGGGGICRFVLSGTQNRSELILGGNGTRSTAGTAEFHEGDEFWYGFSFYIDQMVYGKPGAHNLIMQFKSDGEGSPLFGLQLWNVEGKKGLWSAGSSMQVGASGERFLAPLSEHAWHRIQIHMKASERGTGSYEVFLDGTKVDARSGITNIVPGTGEAYIKDGIYRNGAEIPGTSEVLFSSMMLGESQAAIGGA